MKPLIILAIALTVVGVIIAFNFSMISAEEITPYDKWYSYDYRNHSDPVFLVEFTEQGGTIHHYEMPLTTIGSTTLFKIPEGIRNDIYPVFFNGTTYHHTHAKYTLEGSAIVDNHERINHLEDELAKQIQRTITLEQRITELQLEIVNLKN